MALHHRLMGRAARLLWFVTRPRTIGVRAIVVDAAGRVALVRHSYVDGWYLPGGGVKKGESATSALARELREEIAVATFTVERILGVYHARREHKDDHVVVYVVRMPGGAETEMRRADAVEIAEARWFRIDDLPDTLSPATARRLEEYRAGSTGGDNW
jgi:ADP-ribose pyrophosphatase YjhB (NUDIX family)